MVNWIKVKLSRPHRVKKHERKTHIVKTSLAFRIKAHMRRRRRTKAQIAASKKRNP